MKIRLGFVSNSSTSSFCIFGISVIRNEMVEAAKKLTLEADEKYPDNSYEAGEFVAIKIGMEFHAGGDGDDYHYIGRSWNTITDDETGRQFKQSVLDALNPIFPSANCESYSEAFYN